MDRLSELPDYAIFHIFWSLPIIDVVRTTILSKRWENLWTTTPFLNITDNHISDSDTGKKFANIVHRALLRWDGVKVLKFKVNLHRELSIYVDADLWVRFAKKHEVEELYLPWRDLNMKRIGNNDHKVCWVPQYLYSCSSLKVLSINTFHFSIRGNVQWNQLKSLTIVNGFGVTEDVMNQVLFGSPQLEVLVLSFVESGESLCIRSSSLKELSINKYLCNADTYTERELKIWTSKIKSLEIWTPNLKTLEIKGIPYSKCLLMNVSSLNRATLGCYGLHHYGEYHWYLIHGIDGFTSRFLGDLFGQILPSIQHTENITLLSCCQKVLGTMIEGCMNSASPNVKSLQLRFHNPKSVGMIKIFPRSKKLFIEVVKRVEFYDEQHSLLGGRFIYFELQNNLPKSFVLQLRTVEVTLVKDNFIFLFLEFLLKNASKLEKIVVRVKGPLNSLLGVSQKLMKMPRASRTARFTFSEY
ncbi:F-box/LRR-repeat protein At5g02910-like [Salvia miltiorrhiza]|uniref:F-box/LRR-repeat protein At5g02910-like n=1 Tax=Salvia miltiorrhiza TaxID=226208 RepID=UPI0025AD3EB0|nr:F-box/LRR-repeat protein At5g02910-like [Salvia miltiorrhiza]XP_057771490.1 F-box/LRR-repeat protein At5g02910-like [Salvia miltiorrhiza]XP_057771491.1 F-box/LRR-repeat protein At5g02910-like [Salvia miltiorrhiza]